MAKQTINTGTSNDAGDGDNLRTAFNKVNTNFTEVYTRIVALEDGSITTDVRGSLFADDSSILVDAISGTHYGNFVGNLKGSLVGDDSTPIIDGVSSSINLNGTVKGNIVPDTNIAYDIGSSTKRFRDLYLSGNTITIGNQTLSTTATGITSSGTLTANTIQLGTATITSSGSGIQISGNLSTGSGVTKTEGLVGFIYDAGPVSTLHKIDKALFSDVIVRDSNGAVDSVATASAQATTHTFLSGYHITDTGGSARYNDRTEYKNYLDGNPAIESDPFGSVIKAVTDGGGSLIGVEVDKRGENAGPGDNLTVQCINPSQETLSIDTTDSTAFYNSPSYSTAWSTVFEDFVDRAGFLIDGYVRDSTGEVQGWSGYANAGFSTNLINLGSTYPWLTYQRRVILTWTPTATSSGEETISEDRLQDDGTVLLPVDGGGKFAGNAADVYPSLKLKVQERVFINTYSKTYSGSFTIDGQTLNATVSFNPLQNNFGTLTSATIQGGGPIPAGTLSDLVDAETNGIVFNIDDNGTVTSGNGVTGTMGVFIYFNELGNKILPLIGHYEDYQVATQIAGANNTSTVLTPGPEPMPDLLALPPVLIANGTLAVADGTNWDPNGDGTQALMIYLNGQWYKVNLTPVP
jgi:hypothetical protein